ncbi:nitrilase-related carbon-nitrogen hydrolase, partial [Helicobacter pylori]|uniref:nitrilase-related carbon-nitrogen hydrolase n=1 Tax=Helicobacter pylori TaxID=210 RepID=UPI002927BCC5
DLVDLAGDFKPGDGNGVVHMGGIPVGVATCYEVAEDEAYRMAVRGGAQILSTPTNNDTFGFTDMTYQQLAMSRMRAIETDRAVVVVATSG